VLEVSIDSVVAVSDIVLVGADSVVKSVFCVVILVICCKVVVP